MSETFPKTPESESYGREISLDDAAYSPKAGDTIVTKLTTGDEIKYVVTFVGQERQNLPKYTDKGKYLYSEGTDVEVVKFTYTLRGQTQDYTRTREQFANEIKGFPARQTKCSRKV